MKKANNEQPEKDLQCQAELCGRENRLNALGCVAIYLADGIFSLTNDTWSGAARSVHTESGRMLLKGSEWS